MLDGAFDMMDGCACVLKQHGSALIGSREERLIVSMNREFFFVFFFVSFLFSFLSFFFFLKMVKSSHSARYLRNVNNRNGTVSLGAVNPPGWVEDSFVINAAILLQLNKL